MSKALRLEPGEYVVVSTMAHSSKLLKPAMVLIAAVFVHGLLQRMLQVRWRPVDQPWTTVHSLLGTALGLLLVIVVVFAVIRPLIRWALTRFVLTNRRLMLLGSAAPRGGVRIPLAWLVHVEAKPGRGLLGRSGIGTLSADFGQAGLLRLSHAPRAEDFAALIEHKAAVHRHFAGTAQRGHTPGGWGVQR